MAWTPDGWRRFEARQLPHYPDAAALGDATRELASYPPLVAPDESRALTAALAEVQAGRAFLLQGGDCAESFAEFSPANIDATFRLIMDMAATLAAASGLPIVKIARMAGQFAKPRSTDVEQRGTDTLPAYRGDIVNGIAFDGNERLPDPARMFRAYAQAYATLSRLRGLADAEGETLYTCHEALLLPYEEAQARIDPATGRIFAASAHFLWIGDRTRFPGSAHVEFARGLANAIGIKCGPSLDPDTLLTLLDTLNPAREDGKITLIGRMGSDRIGEKLPPLLRAVAREGHKVIWACDPMHGNTIKAASGYKTRPLARILSEVRDFFAIVSAAGAIPGGIHVEMTGQNVTECTGGTADLSEHDLGDRYRTHCDPRLNPEQAMELAHLLGGILNARRNSAAA